MGSGFQETEKWMPNTENGKITASKKLHLHNAQHMYSVVAYKPNPVFL
jgi:hypothetical protein